MGDARVGFEDAIFEDEHGLASVTSVGTWLPMTGAPDDEPPWTMKSATGYVTLLNPGPHELTDAATTRVRQAIEWLAEHWGCDPVPASTDDGSVMRADGSATLAFVPSEDLVMVCYAADFDDDGDAED